MEVTNELPNLKIGKLGGTDGITNECVNKIFFVFGDYILQFFNLCFAGNSHSETGKILYIQSLYKRKGEKQI